MSEAPAAPDVEGWLTEAQAQRLQARAREVVPGGRIVEIGSFRGRSTIALARAATYGVEVVAIDPHAGGDRGPQEIRPDAGRGEADHAAFATNLAVAGVADRVRHVRRRSDEAIGDVEDPIGLLFVDGAHRFGPARSDLARWGAKVAPGGAMLVHDAFSSIGVTLALLTAVAPSGRWRYAGRTGSLAEYRREPAPRARELARQVGELPWFARNVLIKALVLAGARPAAHRLGLPAGAPWPY